MQWRLDVHHRQETSQLFDMVSIQGLASHAGNLTYLALLVTQSVEDNQSIVFNLLAEVGRDVMAKEFWQYAVVR